MAIQAAFGGFDEAWFKALAENQEEAEANFERYKAKQRLAESRSGQY